MERRFRRQPEIHPEGKQFQLTTAKTPIITTTSTHHSSRSPSTFNHTPVTKTCKSVKIPTFPKTFSSLFSSTPHKHPNRRNPSSSSKGILPLPPFPLYPVADLGWTTVSHRKRQRRVPRAFPSSPPPRKCFFFATKPPTWPTTTPRVTLSASAAISRECPHRHRSITSPLVLAIPSDTSTTINNLSSYALFYLASGCFSVHDLRGMLAYHFNHPSWPFKIKQAAGTSFMVEFPSDEIMDMTVDLKIIDMDFFKGCFLWWREDLSLTVLLKPFLIRVRVYRLPIIYGDGNSC